ncbi:hypothetical protein NE865_03204 [Phthorimaea operculella]|nr:hypothetical protein NE865_03204 [Phthorimaea operculella]
MPKRRHKDGDDEKLEFLTWKLKKLERKLDRRTRSKERKQRDRSRSRSRARRSRNDSRSRERSSLRKDKEDDNEDATVEELLGSSDEATVSPKPNEEPKNNTEASPPASSSAPAEADPSTEVVNTDETPTVDEIDSDLLDILGVDPSATVEYGKDIHGELASRLQHIATSGLTKESRKELNEKYLIPANCAKIGAPAMNPEIKAAVTETVMKRDKGIEARQKQLACAISGLADVINKEIETKEKDNTRVKQLMDICRILCDIQHAESVTRRNFAIFSIKKELKEHLVTTKIDKTLFGDNLAETLKSAKAVTKSGSELKTKPPPKPNHRNIQSNLTLVAGVLCGQRYCDAAYRRHQLT